MFRSTFEQFVTDVHLWGNLKATGLQIPIETTRYITALSLQYAGHSVRLSLAPFYSRHQCQAVCTAT
jgi:hypothetical protein